MAEGDPMTARLHHVANVIPLHRPVAVNPRHPSMYDRTTEPPAATVTLTRIEAQLIASLLQVARGHLPSPKAVDDAIGLLVGDRK